MKQYVINDNIRSHQIRLIDENGINHGLINTNIALKQAFDTNLDLVQISDQDIPVCKILDYGKFKFDQSKKEKESLRKSKASTIEMKEIWFRPVTDIHDITIKMKKIQKFLSKGNRVKIGIKFRGRERNRIEASLPMIEKLVKDLGDINIVQEIKIQGNTIVTIVGGANV